MDHQAGRLVDHEQMLVLVDDRQRDFLRLVVGRLRCRNCQCETLVALHLDCRVPDGFAIASKCAGLGQDLQTLTREAGDGGGKCAIEPPAHMAGVERYFDFTIPPGH